jgi:hypothetical protein
VLALADCLSVARIRRPGTPSRPFGLLEEALPAVLPVDYAVHDHDVVILVGEGPFGHIADQLVALQVDGSEARRAWSVLVRGYASTASQSDLAGHAPSPRVADPGHRLTRIRSDSISGRRLAQARLIDA